MTVKVDADGDIDCFLDDSTLAAHMIMDGVHEYNRIDRLQRALLPFSCNGKDFICNTAYCRIRDLYAVDIADMLLNIRSCHALGIHGQDLFLNVLADAGLVLFQKLRLKFSLSVSRN